MTKAQTQTQSRALERTAPVEASRAPSSESALQVRPHEATLTFAPPIDVWDAGSEWVLAVDLPGADPDSIGITCEDRVLTLNASVRRRMPVDVPHAAEYRIGDYHRTFRLGEDIDTEKISAGYEAGVLTLHMPKVERAQPRKIPISGGKSGTGQRPSA